jgi:metal-responsive CopG/Arc/MetJ family transcriptional regulator
MKKATRFISVTIGGQVQDTVNLNKFMKRLGMDNRSAAIRTLISYAVSADDSFINMIRCRIREDNGRHTR